VLYSSFDFGLEQLTDFVSTKLVVFGTDIGCNGESGRDRDTNNVHLGKVCTLSAQQVLHVGFAFGLAVSKKVNAFCSSHLSSIVINLTVSLLSDTKALRCPFCQLLILLCLFKSLTSHNL
jgi:hypothetical protein